MKNHTLRSNFLARYLRSRLTGPAVARKCAVGLFSLLYIGCGGAGSPSGPIKATNYQALPDTQATMQAVARSAPSNNCPHSRVFLAGSFSWQILGSQDFSILDLWTFNEDCTFREFNCGEVGYIIDGGQTSGSGLVHLMVLGYILPKDWGCNPLGESSCYYVVDGAGELRFTCQWISPLVTPFLP